tara:strand:+ start:4498 stop:4974 length:477 start_codon:yes stop_codon:yes gene_type:complete
MQTKRRRFDAFFYIYKNTVMKKTLILLSFCSLFLFGCPPPMEMTAFEKIDYTAITRGSSQQITLEKEQLTSFQNNKEVLRKPLNKNTYNALFKLLKRLDLSALEKLVIPSKRHQSDGALAARITILSKGKTYTSPTFDHDNPPKEIKPLVDYLQSLIQ